ncbi:hypothetical protein, partial [Metabacillus idriensis]|uniref:hypothetical protein n=1 Tax=Metabacillus idriensis TaxID=324768 RepID=UPI001CD2B601
SIPYILMVNLHLFEDFNTFHKNYRNVYLLNSGNSEGMGCLFFGVYAMYLFGKFKGELSLKAC